MKRCEDFIGGRGDTDKPTRVGHRGISKDRVLAVDFDLEVAVGISDHLVIVMPQAVDVFEILARLAELRRRQNNAVAFGDNAGAVAVILHFFSLFVERLKRYAKTRRADELPVRLDGRADCHNQLFGVHVDIGLGD